ncbi:MAG: PstS family phosphate ABC transporter substrate-binding protein [Caldisericaceae bacterium]|nr:PstS family phosphate ABC transporter substrate-binding protein [Caldisericaceae bacterium]
MKKVKYVLVVLSVALIFMMAGCGGNRGENSEKSIVLNGSTTVFPIAQRAAEEFMNLHSDVNVSVRGTGSGNGIAALINGTCDIADASRPMKDEEIKKAKENGVNPVSTVIAKDAIAIIVNKDNPIKSITKEQLKEIYTGQITNWKELGGADMKIVPVTRDSSSGTFEIFEEKILGKGTEMISSAVVQGSNQAVKTTVSKTPGAVGYIGLGYVDSTVKTVAFDGVLPSKESVLNGTYEISRPLFMYTDGVPKGVVKEFIDFVMSPEGQKIVEEVGYIAVKPVK